MNSATKREISCRITRTLIMFVRESKSGSLGNLLDGLPLDEAYLGDSNNWVSHAFLQELYHRMIRILGDENAVYKMALASGRFESLGLLDPIVRMLGSPKRIYAQAPKYNKLLKLNGDVYIHELGARTVLLEDRYHHSDQKTRFDCDYTRGILAGIPTLFGLSMAEVREVRCQVSPDPGGRLQVRNHVPHDACGCLYRVRWDNSRKHSFWRRFFFRDALYRKAIQELQEANQRIQEKYDETKQLAADLEQAVKQLVDSKRQLEASTDELKASERRYRMLAENVTDVIWTFSLATMQFHYMSPSVEKMRGFTVEEAMAMSLEQTLAPQSLELVYNVLEEELAREGQAGVDASRSVTIELQQTCKDGSYIWAEATAKFMRDADGRPVGVMGVTRDISDRKQAEKEAGELANQLHQAQRMEAVGRLAAGVAHDLNNILSGIVGYPDLLLLDLPEDSPQRKSILAIKQSGQKAAEIVQDLLTLARRGLDVSEVLNLNTVIEEYLASPEHRTLMQDHPQVSFARNLSDELLNIKGSPIHLAKSIMNLVANAVEAMPAGGRIVLSTRNRYLDTMRSEAYEPIPEGEYVCLTLQDEGIGISAGDIKRIFEPFYTKKSMRRSGTGLGMTVIWSTVKDHDGYIDVVSREGEGTRFELYLPATREEVPDRPPRLVLEDYLGSERILVVDDVPEQRDIAVRMLSKVGYQVSAVASGEEAVAMMQRHKMDLVVLDMIMPPGIDGLETYRRIIAQHPDQRAIIVSGYSESERVKTLLQLGAGAYVQKPYTLEKIGYAVRRELDRA